MKDYIEANIRPTTSACIMSLASERPLWRIYCFLVQTLTEIKLRLKSMIHVTRLRSMISQ